jgi:hypothetical protein
MARTNPRNVRRRCSAGLIATLAALAVPAGARAASAPKISTGPAQLVGPATATLTGSIDPQGQDTSYFFQLGPTRSYGAQSAVADAGAGVQTVHVGLPVGGLQPLTRYHFRLIAINSTGASTGGDMTLTTTSVPLSLQILLAPDPVVLGAATRVQGTLSGTGNGNRAVALQANPFPYTQGFSNVGNAELTDAAGGFSFPVLGLTQATQFRVSTTVPPIVVSPVVIEGVAVRLRAHVGHARRRHFARFYGTVTPAEDGMGIAILRVSHGRHVFVAGTILRHAGATSSRFSRVLRVTRGIYLVLATITDGAHSSAYSVPLRIG